MEYLLLLVLGFVCGVVLGYYILRERIKDKVNQNDW